MKVVLIQSLISPYRYPLFDALASVYDFEVWFMGKKVKNRIWTLKEIKTHAFKYKFLNGVTLNFGFRDNYPFWINLGAPFELVKSKPDVVIIFGWDSLTSFLVNMAGVFSPKTKFILFSESTRYEPSWRRNVTKSAVKLLLKNTDYCLAAGTRAKQYFLDLGQAPEKIGISPTTNDVERYKLICKRFKADKSSTLKGLKAEGKVIILFYGQLIRRKGPDILLSAFESLRGRYDNIHLLIVGSGNYKEEIERQVDKMSIKNVTILENPGDFEICKYYAAADVFVLPSRQDTWGLVVNEAMSCGLPIIVSDTVGSGEDLVVSGKNGYVFRSGDSNDLALKLGKVVEDKELRESFGRKSLEIIEDFKPEKSLRGYIEAIGKVEGVDNLRNDSNDIPFTNKASKKKVSIIIPVSEDPFGLKKTLESLIRQDAGTYRMEVIVVNDGADSLVTEVCKSHEVKEVVIKNSLGSYNARDEALKKSSGEYIAFIDSGTEASEDWIKNGTTALKYADYVGGQIKTVQGSVGKIMYLFGRNREFPVKEFMRKYSFAPTTNLFVRRSVIEKVGGFDRRLKSSGDFEFGDRVKRYGIFNQVYEAGLLVFHPARNYREMTKKQRRLAEGFVDLGTFFPMRFPGMKRSVLRSLLKAIIPPFWLLSEREWKNSGLKSKILVFLLSYNFSLVSHLWEIKPHAKVP